ncbi:MAG TPA: hypothetical protein VFE14_17530, partial [Micromonosporaceae bacterium]|nr:hypothetical protein [Micromonosporaceae bacterium]
RAALAYLFVAPPADPAGPETHTAVTVPATGVEPADYLVRIQVDGAASTLTAGADGRYDTPRVTIP